jgi:hypothetical protein
LKLIEKAQEEETREYAFRIYLSMHPKADPEKFKTFNEFWEEIKPKKIKYDTRNKDDIMQEILELENSK